MQIYDISSFVSGSLYLIIRIWFLMVIQQSGGGGKHKCYGFVQCWQSSGHLMTESWTEKHLLNFKGLGMDINKT